MRFCKILFFYFLSLPILSGFTSTDSLIQILPTLIGNEKVDVLNDLSWKLKFSKNQLAKKYGEEGLSLAKKNNYLEGEGLASYHLGVINSINGQYDISNQYAESCVKIYQKLNDASGIGKAWNVLGINNQNRSNFEEALTYFGKALDLFNTLADTVQILKVEGNIGNVHYGKGDYEQALVAYIKLIELGEEIKDTAMWATNLLNAGNSYSFLGNHPKALEHLFEALDLHRATDNHPRTASTLNGIALILNRLRMYQEAEELYLEAFQIYEKMEDYKYMGTTNNNLGNIYLKKKEYDKALDFYNKTLDCYKKAKVKSIGNTLNNIAKIHRERGDLELSKKILWQAIAVDSSINKLPGLAIEFTSLGETYLLEKDYLNAEKYLLKGYDLWSQVGQTKDLSSAAGHLSNLYEATGDLEKALLYRTEYKETEDEVYGMDSQKEVTRILLERQKNKYLSTKQNTLIEQNSISPIYWILAIGTIIGLLIWQLTKRKNLQKQQDKLKETLSQQNSDLENLKSLLDQKNIEVAFLSLTTIQKDEFIRQFFQKLQNFAQKYPQNREAQKILNSLHLQDVNAQNWDLFKQTFEQVSPNFFDNLFNQCPSLTNKELRHCALIRLNIPPKDVAQILGISMSGVHKARYRLRKQFDLKRSDSLENHLAAI
ncbi:MAG: tetratricopeptide repeat protein [Saprospiraceae bacterium]